MANKSINVKMIKLSDINPAINRKVNADSQDFRDFVDNVHQMGVLSPIMLVKNPAGPEPWKIAFGGHRFTATKMLNSAGKTCVTDPTNDFSAIPAILSDLDPNSLGFVQIVENLRTNKCSPTEYANQLLRLMAMPEHAHLTRAEFAEKLGLKQSPSWLNNVLSLNNLLPAATDLVDAGKIAISAAYDLALLPHEEQVDFLERAQTLKAGDFKALVLARRNELKKIKKGITDEVHDPFADAKLRTKKELKDRFVSFEAKLNQPGLSEQAKQDLINRMEGIAWALSLDPETRAAKEAEKKAEQQARDEIRKQRAAILARMRKEANDEATKVVAQQMAGTAS